MTVRHRERAAGVVEKLQRFLDVCAGLHYDVLVCPSGGVRDDAGQRILFAKGRDASGAIVDQSEVVTYAQTVSETAHGRAGALDLAVLMDDGELAWQSDNPRFRAWLLRQTDLGKLAKEHGLEWGGDWLRFKDWVHVQVPEWKSLPIVK